MNAGSTVHVFLDPYIFQVPQHPTVEEGTKYVRALVTWCRFFRSMRQYCSTSGAAVNALWVANRFPNLDMLRVLARDAEELTATDLRNALRVIADQEPYLEYVCGIRDVVVESAEISPDDIVARLDGAVGACLRTSIFIACFARSTRWGVKALVFGTNERNPPIPQVRARGKVTMFETSDRQLQDCDVTVDDRLDTVQQCNEICAYLDLSNVYTDPAVATMAMAMRTDRAMALTMSQSQISAEPGFVESIEKHGIERQGAVLERLFYLAAMAAAGRIAEVEGAKVHSVRVNASPNSAQVERADGAKLWRCMLTKQGAGYRLHYWALSSGAIELSEVVLESEV